MKKRYIKCEILIHQIEKFDVITASTIADDPSAANAEHNNSYTDFSIMW